MQGVDNKLRISTKAEPPSADILLSSIIERAERACDKLGSGVSRLGSFESNLMGAAPSVPTAVDQPGRSEYSVISRLEKIVDMIEINGSLLETSLNRLCVKSA